MSERPADSIAKLADYLWWLLPSFLKTQDRSEALVARLCEIWGAHLDDARATLIAIIPELVAATASGTYLDLLARQRQITRSITETDESLRARVLAAHTIKRKGGTIPGMIEGLAKIGYVVAVSEPSRGSHIWSRFQIRVLGWDGIVSDQAIFYQTVRALKPAHSRGLVDNAIPACWDDGGALDAAGSYDDFQVNEVTP